jgi:histidine triad (HIT) family protein
MDCIFCKIINGEIPCYKIYEDEVVLAFLDINPDSNGHTLIIPKKHFKDLNDIDDNTLIHILSTARKLKERIENVLKCDGITLIQNNGAPQEVKHFHLHLKPYYNNNEQLSNIEDIYNQLKDN